MKDLSLQFFGRLFAIEPTTKTANRQWKWWCHCECGNFVEVIGYDLTRGNTRSCGCLARERTSQTMTTHGDSQKKNSPYSQWRQMKSRTSDPRATEYNSYGGRGIAVCEDWLKYESFKYWAILHGWHKGLTIDRIDNDGNYCPENCEWVTREENARRQHK